MAQCSSTPSTETAAQANTSILEPVEETKEEQAASPTYTKLLELFQQLGYESIGMQFENDATLELLFQVFSNTKAANRQIKLIYTGLQMSYDPYAQSLTVGGLASSTAVLNYLERNVRLTSEESAVIVPPARITVESTAEEAKSNKNVKQKKNVKPQRRFKKKAKSVKKIAPRKEVKVKKPEVKEPEELPEEPVKPAEEVEKESEPSVPFEAQPLAPDSLDTQQEKPPDVQESEPSEI